MQWFCQATLSSKQEKHKVKSASDFLAKGDAVKTIKDLYCGYCKSKEQFVRTV